MARSSITLSRSAVARTSASDISIPPACILVHPTQIHNPAVVPVLSTLCLFIALPLVATNVAGAVWCPSALRSSELGADTGTGSNIRWTETTGRARRLLRRVQAPPAIRLGFPLASREGRRCAYLSPRLVHLAPSIHPPLGASRNLEDEGHSSGSFCGPRRARVCVRVRGAPVGAPLQLRDAPGQPVALPEGTRAEWDPGDASGGLHGRPGYACTSYRFHLSPFFIQLRRHMLSGVPTFLRIPPP